VTDDLDRDFAELVAAELGGYVISAEIRWERGGVNLPRQFGGAVACASLRHRAKIPL
jgi:hypothetical protein